MKNIFDKFNVENDDLTFVFTQLQNNNYIVLPSSIANGKVLKIMYDGNLETDGYERGYLILPYGSGIKEHIHQNDIEQYMVLLGSFSINGEYKLINECFIGGKHSIDPVCDLTIIKTTKISKKLFDEYNIEYQKKLAK